MIFGYKSKSKSNYIKNFHELLHLQSPEIYGKGKFGRFVVISKLELVVVQCKGLQEFTRVYKGIQYRGLQGSIVQGLTRE